MKFCKRESKTEEVVRHIFEYYRICNFRLKSAPLFDSLFPDYESQKVKKMTKYVELVQAYLNQIPKNQKEILLFIYEDKKTYHDSTYSQSAFFALKKQAINSFFELLEQTLDLGELTVFLAKGFKES